jgi:hypothetical protein
MLQIGKAKDLSAPLHISMEQGMIAVGARSPGVTFCGCNTVLKPLNTLKLTAY